MVSIKSVILTSEIINPIIKVIAMEIRTFFIIIAITKLIPITSYIKINKTISIIKEGKIAWTIPEIVIKIMIIQKYIKIIKIITKIKYAKKKNLVLNKIK